MEDVIYETLDKRQVPNRTDFRELRDLVNGLRGQLQGATKGVKKLAEGNEVACPHGCVDKLGRGVPYTWWHVQFYCHRCAQVVERREEWGRAMGRGNPALAEKGVHAGVRGAPHAHTKR